jgi:DNA-binding transcriptional LysR family regulator
MAVNHDEQADHLRDGHAEIGLIREPFDDRGLDSEELFSEPRVVLLPDPHPLASRPALELAQLTDLPVLRWAGEHGDAILAWPPDIAGHDWVPGPQITDTTHLHAITRLGQGIGFVPESMARTEFFAGVRAVRVIDAPPSTLRIAWAESSTSPLVAGFIRHATTAAKIA